MKKTIIACLGLLLAATVIVECVWSQPPALLERFMREIDTALATPFKGMTTDGKVEPDLFPVKSTGVSTEPVRLAAEAFLNGLSDDQRKKTLFPVDDSEWRKWDNRHFYARQGVSFENMTEKQRGLAFGLLQSGLSAKGLTKTKDIMKLNGTLAEMIDNFDEYGEWKYFITIMGQPSKTKPWGWQLEGHHVCINFFVLGDQVVMTPVFMGSEPIRAESGKFKGTVVLQDEQKLGLALIQSLSAAQQKRAIVQDAKGPTNTVAESFKDNVVLDYAGIPVKDLNDDQQKLFFDVVNEFIGNMKHGHAQVKMDEVKSHLDRTYFAWIGGTTDESVYYYRIHSPVVMIEFDHQRPIELNRSRIPTRNHVHTVVRTPNGNDYGKDLLRQHYEHHHKDGSAHDHKH